MFLYAKVVLENLLAQNTLYDLKQEMNQNNFPDELDKAYETQTTLECNLLTQADTIEPRFEF